MGSTEGVLTWRAVHAPEEPTVDVAGTVTDGSPNCKFIRDDEMYAVASFTAYSDDQRVDKATAQADNTTEPVSLTLAAPAVDRVVVRVCRYPLGTDPTTAPGTCGKRQTYRR